MERQDNSNHRQAKSTTVVPRGLRNNNPLNIIRTKTVWEGMAKEQKDKRFVTFETMEYGWRAAFILLTRTYYKKWHLNTIRKIITRWAPPQDGNNTEHYIAFVSKYTRRDADATLPPPWLKPECWQDLAWVMAMMENGNYPMDPDALLRGWDKMRVESSSRAKRQSRAES